jgi:hypothetical protein
MPGTVDDFMNRVGGSGTIDDSEAEQYHDRLVSTNADDRDFDNQTYNKSATEYLGKLPDDQFQNAARSAYNDAARLMNYTRSERPELLQKTVEEKPWFVKAMGNPLVMGVLAMAATKLISSQLPKAGGGPKS